MRTAVAVDINRPKSAEVLAASITEHWPDLADSVHYVEGSIDTVIAEQGSCTLLVAAHACGSLSDRVLMAAITSCSPVAIMPCCHSLRKQASTLSILAGASLMPSDSVDKIFSSAAAVGQSASIDQFRIDALTSLGYQISEDSIHEEISAFNRIIMGTPPKAIHNESAVVRSFSESPNTGKRLGEIRACEKLQSLNVTDIKEARLLSKRPSREWFRFFDLSYWVDNESMGQGLASELDSIMGRMRCEAIARTIAIRECYIDPSTKRLAFTYRIEMKSSKVAISKLDAIALREKLCITVKNLSQRLQVDIELRGST